jgi:hypothetical protein
MRMSNNNNDVCADVRRGPQTASRAITFLLTYSLTHEHLYGVLERGDYPKTRAQLRKHCVRFSLRRGVRRLIALAKTANLIIADGTKLTPFKSVFDAVNAMSDFKKTLKPPPPPNE